MDLNEEQLDYDDEDRGGGGVVGSSSSSRHLQGTISALTEAEEEEEVPDDEEYDDLYQDVNVGFIEPQEVQVQNPQIPVSLPELASRPQVEGLPSPSEFGNRVTDYIEPQGTASSFAPDEESRQGFQGFSSSVATATEQENGRGFRTVSSSTGVGEEESGGRFRAAAPPLGLEIRSVRAGGESTSGPAGGRGGGTGSSAAGTPTSTPRSARGDFDYATASGGDASGSGSTVFVGDLHWWTTDADLEAMLSEYGRVKEIKFFEERASGKSKGYCQVHFYDPNAARLCKEGMNGRLINGKPCVVAFKSPVILKQGRDAGPGTRSGAGLQEKRVMNDGGGGAGGGGRMGGGGGGYHGGGDGSGGGRHYGRSGRGGHGQGRGPGGQGRGRGGKGASGNNAGGHYGHGLLGPMGMQPAGMMPPMGNQGFDPGFGAQMGRGGGGGGYGGFGPHGAHFAGMVPTFPTVGSVGLPGVAPHVNPAFFGRGITANGMAMMQGGGNSSGIPEGHQVMWSDSMWGTDGSNKRMGDSSHAEDMGSDYGYGGYGGDKSHDRGGGGGSGGGGRSSAQRTRERGLDSEWVGNSEKRHRSDRDMDWDRERDRYREKDRDGYREQREREHNWDRDDEYGRDRAARPRSKSRAIEEEDPRTLAEYGKRRR